jgi:hypothetical protein
MFLDSPEKTYNDVSALCRKEAWLSDTINISNKMIDLEDNRKQCILWHYKPPAC